MAGDQPYNMSYGGVFPQMEGSRTYSPSPVAGISTGHQSLDIFLSLALAKLGLGFSPRPLRGTNQGNLDAFNWYNNSQEKLTAKKRAFSNSLLAQRLGGIDPNSEAMKWLGPLITDPDGPIMNMLSPLMGGNPVKAQMGMLADLTGQTMGALGRNVNLNVGQSDMLMLQLYKRAYNGKIISQDDIDKYNVNSTDKVKSLYGSGLAGEFAGALKDPKGMEMFQLAHGTQNNTDFADILKRTTDTIQKIEGDVKLSNEDKTKQTEAAKKDATKSADEFLDRITDPSVKDKMSKAFADALQKGASGVTEFTKKFDRSGADLVSRLRDTLAYKEKKDQFMPQSIDFRATRGFQLEDLTQGFASVLESRLVQKGGLAQTFGDITTNAVPVWDAAREVYGNDKSVRELMTNINHLLGNSYVNLGNKGQAGELEDLLRGIKATARISQVSTDSVLGLIDQGQQLAGMNPNFKFMGGMPIAKMGMDAMSSAAVWAASNDNAYVRMMGGPVSYAQREMAGKIQGGTEPIAKKMAALYYTASLQQNTQAMKFIEDVVNGTGVAKGNSTYDGTMSGFSNTLSKVAGMLGSSPNALNMYASNSEFATQMGMKLLPSIADNYGRRAGVDVVKRQFMDTMRGSQLGEEAHAIWDLAYGGDGIKLDKQLEKIHSVEGRKFANTIEANRKHGKIVNILDLFANYKLGVDPLLSQYIVDNNLTEQVMDLENPQYKARRAYHKALVADNQATSKRYSEEFAVLNAPMVQGLFNGFLNGDSANGLGQFISVFGNKNINPAELKASAEAVQKINLEKNPNDIAAYYRQHLGLTDVTDKGIASLTKLQANHFSFENIRKYASNKGLLGVDISNEKDPQRLKELQAISENDLASGFATLGLIDPSNSLMGSTSMVNVLTKAAIEHAIDLQEKPEYDHAANVERDFFKENLKGLGVVNTYSEDEKKGIMKDLSGIMKTFKNVKGLVDKDGNLDPERYEYLTHGKGVTEDTVNSKKLAEDISGLSSKGPGMETALGIFNEGVDAYHTKVSELQAIKKSTVDAMGTPGGIEAVNDTLQKILEKIGPDFGSGLMNTITKLITSVDTIGTGIQSFK